MFTLIIIKTEKIHAKPKLNRRHQNGYDQSLSHRYSLVESGNWVINFVKSETVS